MTAIAGTRRSMKELVDGTVRVQIDIDPAYRDDFFKMFGKIDMPVALAPLVADFEVRQDHLVDDNKMVEDNGHYIAALYKSGFWFNPKVLAALGTDAEYVAWIQRQPSCVSGEFSEYLENGEGRCVAAHVRRAGKSGTAFKESYATVPLTQAEHNDQHQSGESEFGGKEFFDKKLAEYKAEWAHIQLRKALNVEHLRSASIEQIREWAIKADVYSALPLVFKS